MRASRGTLTAIAKDTVVELHDSTRPQYVAENVESFRIHDEWVAFCASTADFIATATNDGVISIRKITSSTISEVTTQSVFSHTLKNSISSLGMSRSNRYLFCGAVNRTVSLWEEQSDRTYQLKHTFEGLPDNASSIDVFKGDEFVIFGLADGKILVFDLKSGSYEVVYKSQPHTLGVGIVRVSQNVEYVATASEDSTTLVYHVPSNYEIVLNLSYTSSSLVISPNSQQLVCGGGHDRNVTIFSIPEGRRLRTLSGHSSSVVYVGFSLDEEWIVSGGDDRKVFVWWREGTDDPVMTLSGLSQSPVGIYGTRKRISVVNESKVQCWDVQDGSIARVLSGFDLPCTQIVFSTDGTKLAIGCEPLNTVTVYDVTNASGVPQKHRGALPNDAELIFAGPSTACVSCSRLQRENEYLQQTITSLRNEMQQQSSKSVQLVEFTLPLPHDMTCSDQQDSGSKLIDSYTQEYAAVSKAFYKQRKTLRNVHIAQITHLVDPESHLMYMGTLKRLLAEGRRDEVLETPNGILPDFYAKLYAHERVLKHVKWSEGGVKQMLCWVPEANLKQSSSSAENGVQISWLGEGVHGSLQAEYFLSPTMDTIGALGGTSGSLTLCWLCCDTVYSVTRLSDYSSTAINCEALHDSMKIKATVTHAPVAASLGMHVPPNVLLAEYDVVVVPRECLLPIYVVTYFEVN
eukprot:PhF_6_TR13697/c0_g1_i1/m.22093